MRILILTQYFPPETGAPQNRLYELAVRLQRKGASVTILTAMPNYPQMEIFDGYKNKWHFSEEMDGMKVERAYIFVRKSKSLVFRMLNYFSFVFSSVIIGMSIKGKFDYLICESPPLFLGISGYILSRVKKAKFIFNVSDLWPESAEKLGLVKNKIFLSLASRLEHFCYRTSFFITGQTQGIVKNISSRFPSKKVHWLPNGVDLSYFHPNIISGWRAQNNFGPHDFILLYAGIFGYAQGLEVILQAAGRLNEKKQIKFVLAGSGPEKEKLLSLKKQLGVENVFFYEVQPKSKMPEIVAAADVAVIPLLRLELFKGAIPSKIFENLAMKKPVLLGIEGEAKELFIDEGKCGLSFIPENSDDLAEKILQLYNNPELVKQLGNNGYDYVAKKFERNKIAAEFWEKLNS